MDCKQIKQKLTEKITIVKKYVFSKKFLKSVLLGQFLSVLICGTALTSGLLQENNVNIPTGQSLVNYILLALFYTTWNLWRVGVKGIGHSLRHRGIYYMLLGVVEVEANFMIIKAYQLTSVTSVQLLDCLAIPTILILSRRFLNAHYVWQNYLGVVVCLLGAGLLVLADYLTGRYESSSHQNIINSLIGDALCIGGSLLYGCLGVAEEIMVGRHGSVEYLSLVASAASVVSAVQFFFLERHQLPTIDFSITTIWLSLSLFTVCMFTFYSTAAYVIKNTSAMSVNLNLLSSDVFSLVIGIFVFQYNFHWLHFASFFIILVGVVLYNIYSTLPSSSPPSALSPDAPSLPPSSLLPVISSSTPPSPSKLKDDDDDIVSVTIPPSHHLACPDLIITTF